MNRFSPHYSPGEQQALMVPDQEGGWVHINSVEARAVKALERRIAELEFAFRKLREKPGCSLAVQTFIDDVLRNAGKTIVHDGSGVSTDADLPAHTLAERDRLEELQREREKDADRRWVDTDPSWP